MKDYKSTAAVPGAAIQPQPAPPTPEELLIHSERAGVWIPLAQNFWGGVGAATVITIGLHYLAEWPFWPSFEAAALTGGIIFGLATMVRMFRDEIGYVVARWGEKQDRAARQALEERNRQLEEVVKAYADKDLLSNRYTALLTIERLLGDYYDRHWDVTRAEAMRRGMTRPAWDAAMTILRNAGVVNGKGGMQFATKPEAWSAVMVNQQSGIGQYVRTADDDLVKVK